MARCRGAPRIDSTGDGFDPRTSCPLLPPPTGMRDPADRVAPDLGHGGGRRAAGRCHPGRQGHRRRRPASRHLCDRAVRSHSPLPPSAIPEVPCASPLATLAPGRAQLRSTTRRSSAATRLPAPPTTGASTRRMPCKHAGRQAICCRWRNCNAQVRRLSARGAADPILSGHGAAAGCPSLPLARFQTPCHAPQSMLGFPPTPHVHGAPCTHGPGRLHSLYHVPTAVRPLRAPLGRRKLCVAALDLYERPDCPACRLASLGDHEVVPPPGALNLVSGLAVLPGRPPLGSGALGRILADCSPAGSGRFPLHGKASCGDYKCVPVERVARNPRRAAPGARRVRGSRPLSAPIPTPMAAAAPGARRYGAAAL